MAEVITRFKLETTQYDSALRNASQQLAEYGRKAMAAGNEFQKFTQGQASAAKALGNIAVAATNPKDKVKELVAAFNDAAKAYNALTLEQQKSDWGKGLAESLSTLKGRISEAKGELYSMGDTVSSSGGIMSQLAQKITLNIDAMKLFSLGLKAGEAALSVAKDAFFASEATVDEWGRTMASAEAVYSSFLTSLNNSDFSTFLTNINEISVAARDLYDALDTLGTMKTIQSPAVAKQEAENQRLRTMIMTGKFIEAGDGRKSPLGLKNGDQLTAEQIRILEKQLQNGMAKIVSLTKNELDQTGKAINKYYESLAKQNGISLEEFRKGTSSWDEFQKRLQGYERYKAFESEHTTYVTSSLGTVQAVRDSAVNPDAEYRNWGTFRVDKMGDNSYNDLVNLIKQQQSQQSQMYSTIGQAYRAINRAEGVTVRSIMGGTKSPEQQAQAKIDQAVKDYNQALEAAALAVESGQADTVAAKKKELSAAEILWKAIGDAREVYDSDAFKTAQEEVAKKVVELGGSVNALVKEQNTAQEMGREMAAAQKKVTTALEEAAQAYNSNDLKGYITAQKKLGGDATIGFNTDVFSATTSNIDAFIADLKSKLNDADVGSILYKNLTDQLADATALADVIQLSLKNGIDVAESNPQDLWKKILGENPGDYIEPEVWEGIAKKMNDQLKKIGVSGVKFDKSTGSMNTGTKNSDATLKDVSQDLGQLNGGVNSIVSGLTQLGIELPEGLQEIFGGIQAVTSILSGIATVVAAIQTVATINTFKLFSGGGVVHAANGFVPGTHYSGDMVPALLNSGELVLNMAQQNNLATLLTNKENQGVGGQPYVSGQYIFLGMDNYLKGSGKGQIVTTQMLKQRGLW